MKKALFSAALMFVFSVSMLLGTTYAWWSEEIVVDENIIQMGELDLTVELADPLEWFNEETFEVTPNWYNLEEYQTTGIFETRKIVEPGSMEFRLVKFTNEGTIPLAYRVHTEVEENALLQDYIYFGLVYLGDIEQVLGVATLSAEPTYGEFEDAIVPPAVLYENTLVDLTSPFAELAPGESHVYLVAYYVDETLGDVDGTQGELETLPFELKFEAQQIARAQQLGTIYEFINFDDLFIPEID